MDTLKLKKCLGNNLSLPTFESLSVLWSQAAETGLTKQSRDDFIEKILGHR